MIAITINGQPTVGFGRVASGIGAGILAVILGVSPVAAAPSATEGTALSAPSVPLAPATEALPSGRPLPAKLPRAGELRVMALGDSITAGVGAFGARPDTGGYRGVLAKLLAKNGYRVRFVGSRSDYSAAIEDRAHEGWPGYVLRSFPSDPGPGQLYGSLVRTAIERNDPDMILLMAGTNDLLRLERRDNGYTLANITQSMNLLLAEIFRQKPTVRVIVAPVVASPLVDVCTLARFDGFGSPCGASTTENLATLVRDYAARGFHISLARGMAGAVPRDRNHFPDGIHPCGPGGYDAVASAWFEAISEVTAAAPAIASGKAADGPAGTPEPNATKAPESAAATPENGAPHPAGDDTIPKP